MDKIPYDDKLRMQTLHKQEFDAKAIAVTSPPQNSQDLNPTDYHVWGAMLQTFHKYHPKPKTIPELKSAQQQIWDDLPQTMNDQQSC